MKSMSIVVCCLLAVVICCAFGAANAQVNFSPAWGKRASSGPSQSNQGREPSDQIPVPSLGDCKLPIEAIARVFKMIQVEAQRLLRCEGLPQENRK